MASDLIDRKALGIGRCKEDVFADRWYAIGWNNVIAIIEEAPAVDAVEVVRCKDCVSCEPIPHTNNSLWCDEWVTCTDCDGFCHKGVKKDAVD